MTSLSNLIKLSQYVPVEVLKKLDLAHQYSNPSEPVQEEYVAEPEQNQIQMDAEAERLKEEMLNDAKEFAERQIREASEEAERMLSEAKQQIEQWWNEQREQDEHLTEAVKVEGYDQGYREGRAQAEQELAIQIEEMMSEARGVLEEAYRAKEQIIQESEPFLVDLSCAIAEKVIDKQLTIAPDLAIDMIKKNLARKREQGRITLCVSPSDFSFVQAAREELEIVIDSQAELQILPDATVKDKGCVIRSAYGSVDARIDTQLAEIKKELIRVALDHEESNSHDDGA